MATPTDVILDPGGIVHTNLIPNPSFETDADGWQNDSFVAATTLARQTGWASSGDAALRFTISDANATPRTVSVRIPYESVDITGGEDYFARADVNVLDNTAEGSFISIDWWESDGTYLGRTDGTAQTGTGVKELTVQATAPATAATASVAVRTSSGSSDVWDLYIDSVLLVESSVSVAYFDGDSDLARWSTTPHASVSYLYSNDLLIDREPLALNSGAIQVGPDGIDWGDAELAAVKAELDIGEVTADYRLPNRVVTIPLLLGADDADGFATAKAQLQAKVALLQREGGWIQRGEGVYADVMDATLKLPDRHGHLGVEADVVLTLECSPDFYGDERAIEFPFTPDKLAGLEMWLKPETLGDPGRVDSWADSSGNGNDATQANTDFQPQVVADQLDGHSVMRFDGTSVDYLNCTGILANDPTRTIIVVGKHTGGATTGYFWTLDNSNGEACLGANTQFIYVRDNGFNTINLGGTPANWNAVAARFNSTSSLDAYINGGAAQNIDPRDEYQSTGATMVLGQRLGGSYLSGDIAEVLVFDSALSDTDLNKLLGYLSEKYPTLGSFGTASPTVSTVSETELPELTVVFEDIEGDYPGRVRVEVEDLSGQSQLGLLGGFRCRHYSSDSTAALAYEAEALDPLDEATTAFPIGGGGASNGGIVLHAALSSEWTPVVGTNVASADWLTHTGSYRVWARVATDSTDVQLRFVYDVGDLVHPEENAPWTFPPSASQWYLADLGEVRLDPVPVGSHRWQGQIQARGAVGGEDVEIDRIYFQPLDENAWKLRAPLVALEGLVDYTARDEFNQSAGALAGKVAASGQTWTAPVGGSSTDFTVDATNHVASRTKTGDTGANGRFELLGSDMTTMGVRARITNTLPEGDGAGAYPKDAVVARYVDFSNWLAVISEGPFLKVQKMVGGADTTIGSGELGTGELDLGRALDEYDLALVVDASGVWAAWLTTPGASLGTPALIGYDADLATGGTLESGKAGIYDEWTGSNAATRTFDAFSVWVPTFDAVLYPDRAAELRTDGFFREDSAGLANGRVTDRSGSDLPRIPPSGADGRAVELFLLASRGDLVSLPDAGIDDKRAQVFYRPSWLFPQT